MVKRIAKVSLVLAAFGALTACAVPVESGGDASVVAAKTQSGVKPEMIIVPPPDPCAHVLPTYVVRVQDWDGWWYGIYDGFSLPFPTPWLTNQNPVPATQQGKFPFVYELNQYNYEQALAAIPGHAPYQAKVRIVTLSDAACTTFSSTSVRQCVATVNPKDFFFLGFSIASYQGQDNWDAYFGAQEQDVEASFPDLTCVRVMDGSPTVGSPVAFTGYAFPFGDVHDPHNPPI